MKSLLAHFRKFDLTLVVCCLLLIAIGLLSIYSSFSGRGDLLNFKKQIVFAVLGILMMIGMSFFDWRGLRDNPYFILTLYFLCVLALLGLFFFAHQIRGVKSWYKIGPFSLDPVEFTKIVLIILLAKYFSMRHVEMYRLQHIILSGIYAIIPAALVFYQPNFGSAMILVAIWIGILIVSGIKLRHFLILALCGILVFVLSWSFLLKGYQRQRIISFLSPQTQTLGVSWNQMQSKIAIGSGGFWGQGFQKGSQARYGFLPEPHTDFIFAAISEEFGFIGASALFLLYGLLLWRVMRIALRAYSNFPRLFASGFTIFLISHLFIHIGMNLGLLPVIGIPLPFVSYGGSGLIAAFIGLGILQSIHTH